MKQAKKWGKHTFCLTYDEWEGKRNSAILDKNMLPRADILTIFKLKQEPYMFRKAIKLQ